MKYVVIKTSLLIDSNGDIDEGGIEKYITENRDELRKNGKTFQNHAEVKRERYEKNNNGSNSVAEKYRVYQVTNDEAEKIEKIIDDYNSL